MFIESIYLLIVFFPLFQYHDLVVRMVSILPISFLLSFVLELLHITELLFLLDHYKPSILKPLGSAYHNFQPPSNIFITAIVPEIYRPRASTNANSHKMAGSVSTPLGAHQASAKKDGLCPIASNSSPFEILFPLLLKFFYLDTMRRCVNTAQINFAFFIWCGSVAVSPTEPLAILIVRWPASSKEYISFVV